MSETHLPVSEDPIAAPPGPASGSDKKRAFRFCASSFGVVRLEDVHEIADLKADLVACYRPVNSQEMFALERMAIAQQFILRAARLDAGLFTSAMNEVLNIDNNPIVTMEPDMIGGDIEITRQQNRNFCMAEGFRRIAKESDLMNLALRYRIQAERDYRRALEEFQRLERLRPKLPNEPDLLTNRDPEGDIAAAWELSPWIPKPAAPTQPKAEPKAGPQPQPAAAPTAPLADVSLRKFRQPETTQPYIPQTGQPVIGPQASSTGRFDISSYAPATHRGFAFRNNTLVPILEPEGSRARQTQVYSNIGPAESASARPRARAPRVNNPSVHRRAGQSGNSENASRASGNTCRKDFSCGSGSLSGGAPPVFHPEPHS